jgi:competence protein ComGC
MMIVVLIIGILIAIALPNFLRARENARLRACVANMKQIQAAIEQWAMEEKKASDTAISEFPSAAQLVSKGYLKTEPKCPSGGTYDYTGSNLTDYDINCSVHKKLSDAIGNL